MRTPANIPSWVYILALVTATVVWGGSFTVMKDALNVLTPGWLLALRFFASALIIVLLFYRRCVAHLTRRTVVAGVSIGITYGLAYLVQNVGLDGTTPGKNAFLTATYCVMVPFINAGIARRAPTVRNIAAAITCLIGVGLVALGGGDGTATTAGAVSDTNAFALLTLSPGDALTLVGAVLFAINIVQLGRLDGEADVIGVTAIQMAVCAGISLVWALITEPLPTPAAFTYTFWMQMAYVVLLSTVFAVLVQNVAQQHVPPAQAALLLSLESVFGALFSILLYGEQATPALIVGFVLIFAAIVVSELAPKAAWGSDD